MRETTAKSFQAAEFSHATRSAESERGYETLPSWPRFVTARLGRLCSSMKRSRRGREAFVEETEEEAGTE